MDRRNFLLRGRDGALALALLPLGACFHRPRGSTAKVADKAWRAVASDFEAEVPQLMKRFKVPGVSLALFSNAQIVWRHGFGVKDAATREPVTARTIFQACSMSKPVFAYVALKQCERGIIGLDTPLMNHASPPFIERERRLRLITPRHLLSHSSGLTNIRSGDEPLKIHFEPGSQYLYSGEGYFYLQSALTHLTGRIFPNDCAEYEGGMKVCATDFADFMNANLLKPFGMSDSGYFRPNDRRIDLAMPHDASGERLLDIPPTGPSIARYGAMGALLTTPTDFARFMIEILTPRPADRFRLTEATLREMLRPHVKVVNGPYTSSWALGWQIQDNGLINHGGDNRGFHCHAIASPKTKFGSVVMTNADQGPQLIQHLFTRPALNPFFGFE